MNPADLLRTLDAWEAPMRGYQNWPHRVALEPPYHPLMAEQRKRRAPIDDARRPGLWERLTSKPRPAEIAPIESDGDPPERAAPSEFAELQLLVPKDFNPRADLSRASLEALITASDRLSFEILGRHKQTVVQVACDAAHRSRVHSTLRAFFPETRVRPRTDDLLAAWASVDGWAAILHLGLADRAFFSLRQDDRGDRDAFMDVIARMDDIEEDELGLIQVMFERAYGDWGNDLVHLIRNVDDVDRVLPRIEEKFREPQFAVAVRIAGVSSDEERALEIAQRLAIGLSTATRSELNQLVLLGGAEHSFDTEVADVLERATRRSGMILSLSELTTLAHLPSAIVRSEHLLRQSTRTRPAPPISSVADFVIGVNEHEGDERVVGLTTENRLRHTYCIGASGTGKSTLLLSMIKQDIEAGRGFGLLDPHGDLIDDVLSRIPPERAGDVVLFDPSDEAYPVGFNVLSAHSELERTLLASDLVGVFRRFSSTFGDQMATVLGNAILAFLESSEGGTLLDLRHFLLDKAYREQFLTTVQDDEVRSYWKYEFPILRGMPQSSILTRLNTFLRPKTIRYMVAQRNDSLDLRAIMDRKKILLAKLSHGAIGEDNAYLLGSLLVARIAQAAMSRQDEDAAKRVPFFLYMDEFHHFITPSIASILSGARKYGLGLVLSHQELRQLKTRSDEVLSAVLGNAFTRIVFRVGEHDARSLADGFSFFEPRDLQNLGIGQAVARIERPDFDFNLRTSVPSAVEPSVAQSRRLAAREASRAQYAKPREQVEQWLRAARQEEDRSDAPKPTTPHRPKERTAEVPPEATPRETDTRQPGRGGPQHKYLQSMVKKLAEERGFVVTTERTVLDGHGYVDVMLERGSLRIGCEISVSTRLEHEVGNLTKCLAAGFDYAVLISSDERLLDAAKPELANAEGRVRFLTPSMVAHFLDGLTQAAPAGDTVARKKKRERSAPSEATVAGKSVMAANEAAVHLGVAVQTLAKMRWSGESPPYHKIGRKVVYSREELDKWLKDRQRRSTSDSGR